mmetsp:Transcript_16375/g.40413  ORF Transcript_16375/g.40413 Transcript_16375/m.40413 type:complete len:469 (+) Transcript_16375:298-1704(+)
MSTRFFVDLGTVVFPTALAYSATVSLLLPSLCKKRRWLHEQKRSRGQKVNKIAPFAAPDHDTQAQERVDHIATSMEKAAPGYTNKSNGAAGRLEDLAPQFAWGLPRSTTAISTTATESSEDTASAPSSPMPAAAALPSISPTSDCATALFDSSNFCDHDEEQRQEESCDIFTGRGRGGVGASTSTSTSKPPPCWSPIDLPPLPVTSQVPTALAWLLYSLTVGNGVLLFVSTAVTLAAVFNLAIYPFVYDREKYRRQFLCVQLPLVLGVVAFLLCQYCWAEDAASVLKVWEDSNMISKAEYCATAGTLLSVPYYTSALAGLYTAYAEKKPDALGSLTMNLSMIAASLTWALQGIFYSKIMAWAVGLASFTLLNCVVLGINVWLRLRIGWGKRESDGGYDVGRGKIFDFAQGMEVRDGEQGVVSELSEDGNMRDFEKIGGGEREVERNRNGMTFQMEQKMHTSRANRDST